MTKLFPRDLDVVITRKTPKTIYYTIYVTGKQEQWRIPDNSTFDTTDVQVGKRYKVTTKVIIERKWHYTAQKQTPQESFDWVSVTELYEHQKTTTKTAKQSALSKAIADTEIAAEEGIFSWGNK